MTDDHKTETETEKEVPRTCSANDFFILQVKRIKIMVADMSYTTVSNVVDSWELLRRIDNYQEKGGVMLFKM
jgi:hypothetical protein